MDESQEVIIDIKPIVKSNSLVKLIGTLISISLYILSILVTLPEILTIPFYLICISIFIQGFGLCLRFKTHALSGIRLSPLCFFIVLLSHPLTLSIVSYNNPAAYINFILISIMVVSSALQVGITSIYDTYRIIETIVLCFCCPTLLAI